MIAYVKQLRINEDKYGTWFYQKITDEYDFDAPIYNLYDADGNFVDEFGSLGDLRHYCKTGEYL